LQHSLSEGTIRQLDDRAVFRAMNIYVTAQTATVWVINAFCGSAERYGLGEPLLVMTQWRM
jgi:hypothetical protein